MPSSFSPRLLITGATGQLGQLVIDALLERVPTGSVVAGARSPDGDAARRLRERGVEVRATDYDRPEQLAAAFAGIDHVLLISAGEIGARCRQHQAAIDAARGAGIGLLAYTSLLHADTSPMALADDHVYTEAAIMASGVPFVLLRNGWYTENYEAAIRPALEGGLLHGCAGAGRIASAARRDYAEAAAVVLTSPNQAGRIYELAGDDPYTLDQFAAAIAAEAGKPVIYQDWSPAEFKAVLTKAGLPKELVGILVDFDIAAARGALDDHGHHLSALIGRPTVPYRTVIRQLLRATGLASPT